MVARLSTLVYYSSTTEKDLCAASGDSAAESNFEVGGLTDSGDSDGAMTVTRGASYSVKKGGENMYRRRALRRVAGATHCVVSRTSNVGLQCVSEGSGPGSVLECVVQCPNRPDHRPVGSRTVGRTLLAMSVQRNRDSAPTMS